MFTHLSTIPPAGAPTPDISGNILPPAALWVLPLRKECPPPAPSAQHGRDRRRAQRGWRWALLTDASAQHLPPGPARAEEGNFS